MMLLEFSPPPPPPPPHPPPPQIKSCPIRHEGMLAIYWWTIILVIVAVQCGSLESGWKANIWYDIKCDTCICDCYLAGVYKTMVHFRTDFRQNLSSRLHNFSQKWSYLLHFVSIWSSIKQNFESHNKKTWVGRRKKGESVGWSEKHILFLA